MDLTDNKILSFISQSAICNRFHTLSRSRKKQFIQAVRDTKGAIRDEKDIPMQHRSSEPLEGKIVNRIYNRIRKEIREEKNV